MKTYAEYEITGIGDHNSVSNGPDNGANDCMARHMWNCMRHGSTAQAVDNFLSRLPLTAAASTGRESERQEPALLGGAGNLNIGGHGNEGLVETGVGQNGNFDTAKYILTWNQSNWGPQLARLAPKSFTMMSIYSCHTGAGEDGADLLWQMARVINRAVRGRTGFTYCNGGITFEKGSVWQVATPDARPTPIPPPTEHLLQVTNMPIVLVEGNNRSVRQLDDIAEITVRKRSLVSASESTYTLAELDARDLAAACFPAEPIDRPGRPLAMVTALLLVKFKNGESREFVVFNDRLIEDTASGSLYLPTPGLRSLLRSL